jgi:CRISPR-associated protein Cmr5
MKTLNQEYALKSHERVTNVAEKSKSYQKKYGTMAHKLPILIRTAGLVQALAFVEAKGTKTPAWQDYLNDVAQTIGRNNGQALRKESQQAELSDYIRLTREVSAALLWYKRFAESILKVEASEQAEDEVEGEES